MPFKLTKSENDQHSKLIGTLNDRASEVTEAIDTFNQELEVLKGAVTDAVEAYNTAVQEATEFAAGISTRADEEISDKSDTWQEGERGQAATEWKDQWENLSVDEVEVDLPDEIEIPDFDAASQLEELPNEADA